MAFRQNWKQICELVRLHAQLATLCKAYGRGPVGAMTIQQAGVLLALCAIALSIRVEEVSNPMLQASSSHRISRYPLSTLYASLLQPTEMKADKAIRTVWFVTSLKHFSVTVRVGLLLPASRVTQCAFGPQPFPFLP